MSFPAQAPLPPAQRVARCQDVLAHAWMVRTFVKHCEEVEDYPELYDVARSIFDCCRALEHLVDQPDPYLRTLRKKLPKLRRAAEKFAHDAAIASAHTNFQQAVLSIKACCRELEDLSRE